MAITSDIFKTTPVPAYQPPAPSPLYDVQALTAPELQASDLTKQLQGLNNSLVGQSAYQSQVENSLGLPQLNQTQVDLTNQLNTLKNEALAIPNVIQNMQTGRGTTAAGIAPQDTAALRENAIKALSVSSLLDATNGNIASAQAKADRAVAQKFDPIKEQIAAAQSNLNLILQSPEYSQAQKTRAAAEKATQDAKAQALARQEDAYKEGLARAAAAVVNNPNDQQAAFAAQQVYQLNPADPAYLQKVYALVGHYQTNLQQNALDTQYRQGQIDLQNAQLNKARATPTAGGITTTGEAPLAGSALVNQPQYQSLTNSQKTRADSLNNLVQALTDYRSYLDQTTGFTGINLFGEDSAVLQSKLNSIIFAAAQAEGTGALQAADRAVIEKIIPNPTSLGGAFNAITHGGKSGELAKIDDQITKYTNNIKQFGLIPTTQGAANGTDQYASLRSQLKGNEILVLRNGQPYAVTPSEFNSATDQKL